VAGHASPCQGSARLSDVQEYAGGLVCLTGGDEGPLAAAIVKDGEEAARKVVETFVQTFGPGNVYVELQSVAFLIMWVLPTRHRWRRHRANLSGRGSGRSSLNKTALW
jgi:hypothetical protein